MNYYKHKSGVSRRKFFNSLSIATEGATYLQSHVISDLSYTPTSDQLNIA